VKREAAGVSYFRNLTAALLDWHLHEREAFVERRLAAILAADAVGYGRMMGEDEPGTLALLQKHSSEVIDPALAKHRCRTVKLIGRRLARGVLQRRRRRQLCG
jgi:class 3 adenylate cyclase